jgi:hypothetical protein
VFLRAGNMSFALTFATSTVGASGTMTWPPITLNCNDEGFGLPDDNLWRVRNRRCAR